VISEPDSVEILTEIHLDEPEVVKPPQIQFRKRAVICAYVLQAFSCKAEVAESPDMLGGYPGKCSIAPVSSIVPGIDTDQCRPRCDLQQVVPYTRAALIL